MESIKVNWTQACMDAFNVSEDEVHDCPECYDLMNIGNWCEQSLLKIKEAVANQVLPQLKATSCIGLKITFDGSNSNIM